MSKKPKTDDVPAAAVKIEPTIGRVVWFTPAAGDPINSREGQPLAALIAYVHSDSIVNLAVFDTKGNSAGRTSVPLLQDGDERPEGGFAEWMPYQKGQAARTQALEKKLHEGED